RQGAFGVGTGPRRPGPLTEDRTGATFAGAGSAGSGSSRALRGGDGVAPPTASLSQPRARPGSLARPHLQVIDDLSDPLEFVRDVRCAPLELVVVDNPRQVDGPLDRLDADPGQ